MTHRRSSGICSFPSAFFCNLSNMWCDLNVLKSRIKLPLWEKQRFLNLNQSDINRAFVVISLQFPASSWMLTSAMLQQLPQQPWVLTSFLWDSLKASSDDVIILLQFVIKPVPPPQLANQLGRLQARAIFHLLDDWLQLLRGWKTQSSVLIQGHNNTKTHLNDGFSQVDHIHRRTSRFQNRCTGAFVQALSPFYDAW